METVILNNKKYDTLSTMIKKHCMNTKMKTIAEKTNLSAGFISDIKTGRRIPSNINTIRIFSTYFDFDPRILTDICKLESLYRKLYKAKNEIKKMEGKNN